MMSTNTQKINTQFGFSMIEFIVVVVIFSIMAGVTMFDYSRYRDTIEQTNVAQDIALSIRQAQVYGLSGSDRYIGDEGFDAGYTFGQEVLDITQDRSVRGVALFPGTRRIVLFEDIDRDNLFNPNNDRIIDERTIVNERVSFEICLATGVIPNSWSNCTTTLGAGVDNLGDHIVMTFRRPYPDATIRYNANTTHYSYAIVRVDGLRADRERYIQISPIGQISIHKSL